MDIKQHAPIPSDHIVVTIGLTSSEVIEMVAILAAAKCEKYFSLGSPVLTKLDEFLRGGSARHGY